MPLFSRPAYVSPCVVLSDVVAGATGEVLSLCCDLLQADKQYEDQKKKEDMAMRYWEAKKIEEQVRRCSSAGLGLGWGGVGLG